MNRRRRRRGMTLPEVSLTPMIDTALVLLVIFMVATPIMRNSLAIDLPQGQMQEDTNPSTSGLVVSVTSQETVQLNGVPYQLDSLLKEISRQIPSIKDKRVYVECDKKASSGMLVKVIDSIKYVAGVEHVVLSTERIR